MSLIDKIRAAIATHPKGLTHSALMKHLDLPPSRSNTVASALSKLKKQGEIVTEGVPRSGKMVFFPKPLQAPAPPPAAPAAQASSTLEAALKPLVEYLVREVTARMPKMPQACENTRALVAGLVARVDTLERDAGLLLENLTKPSPPAAGETQVADSLSKAHEVLQALETKPKRPRICIVGLEGKSGLIEREFPELDLRFIKADDKNRSGVEAVAAGSSEVILLTKFLPHTLTGKLAHKRTRRVEGMAGLREALREIAG